jgi:cytoskeletal protein CcmA (bactofilin family)
MARRDDALGVTGAETLIGAGVVMEGTLESDGDITIDGTFTGTVSAKGDVVLGVNAVVTGNLTGHNVTIAGKLMGNVTAVGEASLRESSNLSGDITCMSLSVLTGGIFIGRSIMQPATLLEHGFPADDDVPNQE